MNQDTLNKIKSYKNSKYVWCAVGGVAGFLIGIYRAALFKVLIFCVVCAVGVILFAIFSKIVNKIYQKRMEAKNNAYGFDYLAEYNIYKKMRKQDAKDDGILYVTEYSDWKARIQKNYEQQKENEDFCHFLVQKKRDIENLKKQVEIISIPLVRLAATAYFEVVPWKEKFSIEEAGIAILAIVFGIAFVVARDIQRWRDQTEFLEDIMQVLGDKEQN